jgi:hypothetical protein
MTELTILTHSLEKLRRHQSIEIKSLEKVSLGWSKEQRGPMLKDIPTGLDSFLLGRKLAVSQWLK